MSDTNMPPNELARVRCAHLRTKKMYIPAEYPRPGRLPRSETAHYWCVRTARPIGPDGRLVHLDTCNRSRDCCGD